MRYAELSETPESVCISSDHMSLEAKLNETCPSAKELRAALFKTGCQLQPDERL